MMAWQQVPSRFPKVMVPSLEGANRTHAIGKRGRAWLMPGSLPNMSRRPKERRNIRIVTWYIVWYIYYSIALIWRHIVVVVE